VYRAEAATLQQKESGILGMRFPGNAESCINFRNSKRSVIFLGLSVKNTFFWMQQFFLHISVLSK